MTTVLKQQTRRIFLKIIFSCVSVVFVDTVRSAVAELILLADLGLQKAANFYAALYVRVQNATLYFSDIADFVDITLESEPMELVSLLNGIYGLIDSQIDAYDVYKVTDTLYHRAV